MGRILSILVVVCVATFGACAEGPLDIGSRRELFVDRYLIDTMDGLELRLHTPSYAGVALKFDAPWEGRFSGYPTVIRDGDRFLLYYRGIPSAGRDGRTDEVTCFAESGDGISWTKPDLGLFEVAGTRDNNVILANAAPFTHNFAPFLDANPNVDPNARFKALAGTANGNAAAGIAGGLHAFQSGDGIHWSRMGDGPVIVDGAFDSQNVAFWSEAEQRYICYFRIFEDGVRSVARCTSADFLTWTDPEPMSYGDTPREQLYTNQTLPYFRAPHIYLALPMRFMPGRRVLTVEQARALGVYVDPVNAGLSYASDCADTVLMSTRGGTVYDRTFMEGFIRPGPDPGNWASRAGIAAEGIVQTGPGELSIYKQFHYAQPSAYLARYTLRLDGFASVYAPYRGGRMTTKPLRFDGNGLFLNFAASAAGRVRVEIQTEDGSPIQGFALQDCMEIAGDDLARPVEWTGGRDIGALSDRPVRLCFEMKDADLYAIQFLRR